MASTPKHIQSKRAHPVAGRIDEALARDDDLALQMMLEEGEGGISLRYRNASKNPLLYTAAKKGAVKCLRLLVSMGAPVNQCVPESAHRAPLLAAISEDHFDAADLLLESGANPRICGNSGESAIYCAINASFPTLKKDTPEVQARRIALIEKLAAEGCPIDLCDSDGKTALMLAIEREFPEPVIETLLLSGADPNLRANNGRQVLHRHQGWESITTLRLLVAHGADINGRDRTGCTPIYYAGHKLIFERMVELGAKIDSQDNDGRTVLNFSVPTPFGNRIETLLSLGADPKIADHNGKTPIHSIVDHVVDKRSEPEEVARAIGLIPSLVEAGGLIDARDNEGCTPLVQASLKAAPPTVQTILLEHGADPNVPDSFYSTPLHYERRIEQITQLLGAGANPNARDCGGRTPIFYAEGIEAVHALVDAGADLFSLDNGGRSVLHHQLSRTGQNPISEAVIHFLLDQGLDPHLADKNGRTPAHVLSNGSAKNDPVAANLKVAIAARDARHAIRSKFPSTTRSTQP